MFSTISTINSNLTNSYKPPAVPPTATPGNYYDETGFIQLVSVPNTDYTTTYGTNFVDLGIANPTYTSKNSFGSSMSADGVYITLCSNDGNVFVSNNSGNTFTITNIFPSIMTSFTCIKLSVTGQYQLITGSNGAGLSANYGSSFTKITGLTNININSTRYGGMSGGGKYMYLTGKGNLYISNNYGTSFSEKVIATGTDFNTISGIYVSNNGAVIGLVDNGVSPNNFWISQDYGTTFTNTLSQTQLWSGSISYTGQYITLRRQSNMPNVYVSNNSGNTWTTIIYNNLFGSDVHMSFTGQYQIVGGQGNVLLSSNYGVSFSVISAFQSNNTTTMRISSTGQYQIVDTGTNVYYSVNYGVSWTILNSIWFLNYNYSNNCSGLSTNGRVTILQGSKSGFRGNIIIQRLT